ncbi:coordinator of PRMT5 and differentiation stimulator isoform X2 [Heliangelus exortis]
MAPTIESARFEEEQLPNERKTMTWKLRKECLLKDIPDVLDSESEESELSDSSHNEGECSASPVQCDNLHPDLEDLVAEISGMPEAVTSPEPKAMSAYEVEDWDKELEDSECDPYDADDFHCGSFQENNLLASYSWQVDSFYNPGCHHAASLAYTPPVRVTEAGQFDDADE